MKTVILAGPVFTRSGYGDHTRSIVKSILNSPEYDLRLIPLPWGQTPILKLDESDEFHAAMLRCVIQQGEQVQQPDIWIQVSIPNEFQPNGKFNIGITAGIESTLTRAEWIEGLNRMDLNIVTSKFSADVFRRNKFEKKDKKTGQSQGLVELSKPMEVLFEGLDLSLFNKDAYRKSEKIPKVLSSLPDFCFLVVGHWLEGSLGQDRKDIGMTIKVFLDTFKRLRKHPPALVLKTGAVFSKPEYEIIRDKIEQIQDLIRNEGWKGDFPPIYILHGNLTDVEMASLYASPKIKAMISFTHGEGFGRPLLEFTTVGKPVIASGWSGQLDFLNPEYSFLLPGKLDKIDRSAQNEWLLDGAEWFRVDYGYASKLLQDVHQNYDSYVEKSRKHMKYTRDNFSEERMSQKFLEILNKYIILEEKPKMVSLNLPKLQKI